MGWGFVKICEHFLGNDWRSLLNDIAKQNNQTANMYISSFSGASEQNTAGCKQAADDALTKKLKMHLGHLPAMNNQSVRPRWKQIVYMFTSRKKSSKSMAT